MFLDPYATTGREMMERTVLAPGLGAIGEAFGPAASIVLGQAGNRPHAIKAILLATLGR
jgi:ornithine carbamoyltransferase